LRRQGERPPSTAAGAADPGGAVEEVRRDPLERGDGDELPRNRRDAPSAFSPDPRRWLRRPAAQARRPPRPPQPAVEGKGDPQAAAECGHAPEGDGEPPGRLELGRPWGTPRRAIPEPRARL